MNLRAALVSLLFATAAVAADRPNVLFIAVDDLKPVLGCYGDTTVKTPNIDALAARGTVFLRAYCQQAVCSPSRTSLLTGCRPDTTKVYDLVTHFRPAMPDAVALPQHFKDNGYHTESLSKIYHPGYDDPKSWSAPAWFPKAPQFGKRENQEELERERREAVGKGKPAKDFRGLPWEDPDVSDDTLTDGVTTVHALERLQALAQDKSQPFFLAVGFLRPHLPFVAPKKYYDLYPPSSVKLADNPNPPKDAPKFATTTWGELRQYKTMPTQGPLSDAQALELIRGYYASVSYTDANVGRLLAKLDELKLRDNTIVILWGDHGWHLGDHGLWCKHTNFESATHAPLIVAAPGKAGNQKSKALVEFVDIYPSLAQLAGLPAPSKVEGTSFVPLMSEPNKPWKRAAFSQYPRGQVMGYTVRTDGYRYTEWVDRKDHAKVSATELYDEQHDPEENVNLAGDPGQKDRVGELSKLLRGGYKPVAAELR